MSSIVYLAGPYTASGPERRSIEHGRYLALTEIYAALCREGLVVFSPITHSHVAARRHGLPTEAAYWNAANAAFLRRCGELWVVTLEGWADSAGVAFEVGEALAAGIPRYFVGPEEIGAAAEAWRKRHGVRKEGFTTETRRAQRGGVGACQT